MPDYIAQLCARCDGLGYMHRDEDGDGIPVSMTDVPHRAALPGIEPCIACERCPDCGRDGTGPGVVWGALRRPWSREAAEEAEVARLKSRVPIVCPECGGRGEVQVEAGCPSDEGGEAWRIDGCLGCGGTGAVWDGKGEEEDQPYVCPGCHVVGDARCAPGCIDAELEAELRDAIEGGDYDYGGEDEDEDGDDCRNPPGVGER